MALRKIIKLYNIITPATRNLYSVRSMSSQTATKETGDTRRKTHFGFDTIDEDDKTEKVREVFKTVADKYDVMNDVMSLGIHRIWKDIFMHRLAPTHGTKLLDVAGGTGDISFRYVNYLRKLGAAPAGTHSSVTVLDINEAMLRVGRLRADRLAATDVRVNWTRGDAERLPLADNSHHAYTIAFGIRNCTRMDKVLEEAYRVLTPGGRFLCLEFSHLPNEGMQWLYDQYSFQVIPVLGQLIVGQWKPYKYLVESIRQFPNQEKFKAMIEDAGFRQVTYENLSLGICAIHSGFKI